MLKSLKSLRMHRFMMHLDTAQSNSPSTSSNAATAEQSQALTVTIVGDTDKTQLSDQCTSSSPVIGVIGGKRRSKATREVKSPESSGS